MELISDLNITLVMVEDGQAFACRRHLSGCNAKEYRDAEVRASRRSRGGLDEVSQSQWSG